MRPLKTNSADNSIEMSRRDRWQSEEGETMTNSDDIGQLRRKIESKIGRMEKGW